MNTKEYLEQSERSNSNIFKMSGNEQLLHAAMGMVTESGEFIDALKKAIFYGKEIDKVNLREELGDILWYMALAMRELDTDFETEMQRNIEKLKQRYPDSFSLEKSEKRDIEKERKILEK